VSANANAVPPPAAWVPLVEVDHRVSQPLLDSLEDAGVAAYAEPQAVTPPVDRLHVDAARRELAEAVIAAELPGLLAELAPVEPEVDPFDAIVAGWDAVPEARTWPDSEDVRPAHLTPRRDDDEAPRAPHPPRDDEGHYVPPLPPPAPTPTTITRWAVLAMSAGIFVLVALPLLGTMPSLVLSVLGALGVLGGLGTLIWRMRDAPSVDDGPDDGAVL
jgi:hypothetical protein